MDGKTRKLVQNFELVQNCKLVQTMSAIAAILTRKWSAISNRQRSQVKIANRQLQIAVMVWTDLRVLVQKSSVIDCFITSHVSGL